MFDIVRKKRLILGFAALVSFVSIFFLILVSLHIFHDARNDEGERIEKSRDEGAVTITQSLESQVNDVSLRFATLLYSERGSIAVLEDEELSPHLSWEAKEKLNAGVLEENARQAEGAPPLCVILSEGLTKVSLSGQGEGGHIISRVEFPVVVGSQTPPYLSYALCEVTVRLSCPPNDDGLVLVESYSSRVVNDSLLNNPDEVLFSPSSGYSESKKLAYAWFFWGRDSERREKIARWLETVFSPRFKVSFEARQVPPFEPVPDQWGAITDFRMISVLETTLPDGTKEVRIEGERVFYSPISGELRRRNEALLFRGKEVSAEGSREWEIFFSSSPM
ncbi:MAG: hypothetical protein QXH08_03065 [Candidatus Hadarchaeales archaeon]